MSKIQRHRKSAHLHGAVEHNGVLYISGHAAHDLTQDMAGQTREICGKLDALLADCGSDKTRLLQARIYITDMALKDEMNKVWLAWLDGAHLPARATIGVADLGDPRRLIEIATVAAVDA
ncbi:RidA family protein [Gemmobacter sp.]|uniref:RidA family protein n=1 Tax=Gemmobacter sp. TaxID=1898957 RepID=UPI002AFE2005|nr:RidA family protein [Gemmobacter sp.]